MDPDVCLDRLIRLSARLIELDESEASASPRERQAAELAQAFIDLDHWIAGGGFLPKGWRPKKPVCRHAMRTEIVQRIAICDSCGKVLG